MVVICSLVREWVNVVLKWISLWRLWGRRLGAVGANRLHFLPDFLCGLGLARVGVLKMKFSRPVLLFACAFIVASSALQASVITPPVRTLPSADAIITTKTPATGSSETALVKNIYDAPGLPICGITDSTAHGSSPTDLPPRDLLSEMAGDDAALVDLPWLRVSPIVIEVSAPVTTPALLRETIWTVPVSASTVPEIPIYSGGTSL